MTTMDNRFCPFCRERTGLMIHDNHKSRAYECSICLAVEAITKSETGLAWWYHGWQQLDTEDKPGLRIDGDGKRYPAPINFLRWATLATNGHVEALSC